MSKTFDDETLVAFLDGELPLEQASTIENELGCDPNLRDRVAGLKRTWDLLGDLPDEPPNPDLARSTIELVTLQLVKEESQWWKKILKNRLLILSIGATLALLSGAAGGKVLTNYFFDNLQRNLPIIAEYESLKKVDSIEWLHRLAALDGLTEAYVAEAIGNGPVPDSFSDRAAWIDELDEIDWGLLEENTQTFRALPEEEKQRLRELSSSIDRDPLGREKLLQVARSYAALLHDRSAIQALKIQDMDPEDRLERVRLIVNNRRRIDYAAQMPTEDRMAIERWWYDEEMQRFPIPSEPPNELMFLDHDAYSDDSLEKLVDSLSQDARRLLDAQGMEDRRLSVGHWVASTLNPQNTNIVNPDQLVEKLEELGKNETTASEVERIEMLPEDKARSELRRMLGVESESAPVTLEIDAFN